MSFRKNVATKDVQIQSDWIIKSSYAKMGAARAKKLNSSVSASVQQTGRNTACALEPVGVVPIAWRRQLAA